MNGAVASGLTVDLEVDYFSGDVHIYALRASQTSDTKNGQTTQVHIMMTGAHPVVYVPIPSGLREAAKKLQFLETVRSIICNETRTHREPPIVATDIRELKRAVGFRNNHTVPMVVLTLKSPFAVKAVSKALGGVTRAMGLSFKNGT